MRVGRNSWKTTLSRRGAKTQNHVESLAISDCGVCNDEEKNRMYRHGCTSEGTDGGVASWSSLNIVPIFLEKKETSEEWR